MSFYEESSIIITPNAYKAGTLYAVVPTSGLADMDVTRATAATRVDENGLVNYAEILGSELITNGDFATDSSWVKIGNFTISGGFASVSVPLISYLYQGIGIVVGKSYKLTIDIESISAGSVRLRCGNSAPASSVSDWISVTGETEVFLQGGGSGGIFWVESNSAFIGSINNVSVKEADLDNVPRIDYTGGGCPHILAEPQRTNLITYSNSFTSAGWSTFRGTITANSITSPDGNLNASRYQEDGQTGSHMFRRQSLSLTNGLSYTGSIFAKKGELTSIILQSNSSSRWVASATFDLENGLVTSGTGIIENYENGWYRCSISGNAVQTTGDAGLEVITSIGVGRDGDGLYAYGAQFEQGSYATSYIPTSGATVTRNQDVFTRDGIGSLINSEEGVLFGEIAALANDGTNRRITINDGTINNRLILQYRSISNQIVFYFVVGGSNQCALIHTLSNATQFNKIALKYKENDFALWVNGVEVSTDTSGNTLSEGTFNNLDFDGGTGNLPFYGKVKQLQVYPTALSDSELTSLTTL